MSHFPPIFVLFVTITLILSHITGTRPCGLSEYRQLHLGVYTWRKNMTCSAWHQTVEVWGGVRRMLTCKVGSCLSIWFVFDQQQHFHRKMLRRIYGVLKLQKIIFKSNWAVSEREISLKIEKNKRQVGRADQKHVNNLTLAATVCFKGCQMFGGQTRHVWHPIRTRFFLSCVHA